MLYSYRGGIEAEVLSKLNAEGVLHVTNVLAFTSYFSGVAEAFPDAYIHSMESLIEDGLGGDFRGVDTRALTPELLTECAWAEPIAMAMMDRLDVSRSFTYQQRRDFYLFLLAYWCEHLVRNNVDLFYSQETPHDVVDYVLFVVMKHLRREVRFFAWTSILGRRLLTDDYRHPRAVFPDQVGVANAFDEEIFKQVVTPLRGAYETAKPSFMERVPVTEANARSGALSLVKSIPVTVSSTASVGASGVMAAMRSYRSPARESYPRLPQTLSKIGNSWQVWHDSKRLGHVYEQLATSIPDGLQYVYYLLGYQPENTNCPEGGALCNQLLAISLLAEALPGGWEVVVKEHPAQLMNDGRGVGDYGFLGRNTSFYVAAAGIPGVRLASLATDHFAMLDAAQAVSTLTGTVGWEASARGKPVLCLGEAWYEGAPNVFTVHDHAACAAAYDHIVNRDLLHGVALDAALRVFVQGIYESSYSVVFDAVDASAIGFAYDESVQRQNFERIFRAHFCSPA
jgi:hypothetical protein